MPGAGNLSIDKGVHDSESETTSSFAYIKRSTHSFNATIAATFWLALMLAAGCGPNQADLANTATWDNNTDLRQIAVRRLNDQSLLAQVAARTADDFGTGAAIPALQKLTNDTLIALVATRALNSQVREAAVNRLTDPVLLSQIASKDRTTSVQEAAVRRLKDRVSLINIAFNAIDHSIVAAAYGQLAQCDDSREISHNGEDDITRMRESLLLKIRDACRSLPEKHRQRLGGDMLELLAPLTDARIRATLGDVDTMDAAWTPLSRTYYGDRRVTIEGESFTFSVRLSKMDKSASYTWSTSYGLSIQVPQLNTNTLVVEWCGANVHPEDILRPICASLPPSLRAQIASDSPFPCLKKATW